MSSSQVDLFPYKQHTPVKLWPSFQRPLVYNRVFPPGMCPTFGHCNTMLSSTKFMLLDLTFLLQKRKQCFKLMIFVLGCIRNWPGAMAALGSSHLFQQLLYLHLGSPCSVLEPSHWCAHLLKYLPAGFDFAKILPARPFWTRFVFQKGASSTQWVSGLVHLYHTLLSYWFKWSVAVVRALCLWDDFSEENQTTGRKL